MAKTTAKSGARSGDEDEKRKQKPGQKVAAWTLTVLLVLGLGGFGVTNFGGGVTSIGSVGEIDISVDDYARAVRQETRAFSETLGIQLGMNEALAFGIDRQALSGLVTRAALDHEAQKAGLSVGDQTVAGEILRSQAFQGLSGSFDRETYRLTLQQNGWSEAEYEETVRRDVARTLLQGAVAGGFAPVPAATDTLYRYIAERRGFSMIRLAEADLPAPLPEPTAEELRAHYDANVATEFTRPEAKRIRYVALLPSDIAADQPVDEAVLRKMYDDRIQEFVIPERRLVERLVYPDAAAADAAEAELAAGRTFEELVEARGLSMVAVDMGDVSQAELGAAGEAVFATAEGAVVRAETDLGPALFRVNGVLDGEETSFDEARELLAAEIQTDAARRVIADKVEQIDDLLAGGSTFEELATEIGMTSGTLDHVPGRQGDDPIEGYQAFRQAADAVAEGDFAEAIVLDDGGVVALEFVETVPAAPIPFDEATEAVAESWHALALRKALSDQAIALKAAVEAGASLGSLGIVDVTPEISREGFVQGTPESLLPAVFAMGEGEVRVIEEGAFIAVVRLDTIQPAADEGEEAEALRAALDAQFEQSFANDAFAAFAEAVSAEAGIALDQAAVSAVNASLAQ